MFRSLQPGAIGVTASFEQSADWAREFDFEGISIPMDEVREKGPDQVKEILKKNHLKPSVFGLPVEFRKDDATFQQGLAQLPEHSERAAAVGLTRCSTWVPPGKKGMSESDYFSELQGRFRECAQILHEFGIRLGLEYIGPKTFREQLGLETDGIYNAEKMLKLVEAIGIPGTGLLLDAWHWHTSHGTPRVFQWLSNENVVDVHVNDAPMGTPIDELVDNRRELPGATEVIDLHAFFNGLRKIGYDGPVSVEPFNQAVNEMDDREAVRVTAESLRKWV